MSQENVEIVRRANQPFQGIDVGPSIRAALEGDTHAIPADVRAGIAAWFDMLAPDFEIDTSGVDMPGFGVLRGPEAMRELWTRWIEGWEHYSWTSNNYSQVGEHVIADVKIRATGKSSGADVIWDHSQVWVFRDGKVIRWMLVNDRASALKAAELSKQDVYADS
jgi:hypothetical protein